VRFVRAGEPVRDVEALLRANSRTPELVLGDIRGQVGVARLGERRVAETIARYGLDAVLETFAHKQDVTERRIRAALASWPDGTFEGESFLDDGGADPDRPVRFQVRVEKRGDRILFDFSGSDDQAPTPINIRPPLARGCCYYALIASIDAQLGNNGGVARVVETRFRPGSLVDPRFPAPCNTYMPSAIALTEALLRALSGFVPERRMAGVGGFGAVSIGGRRAEGSRFVQYDLAGSAYGGRASSDGPSGIAVLLSNARSAPIEVIESEFPTRIARFELIPDSGGAGEFRGGLAARRTYELLADEASLSLRASGHRCAAFGCDGGAAGRPAACTLERNDGERVSLPSRFSGVAMRRGDRVVVDKGGGGGLGEPRRRPFAKIVADVLDGYVTRDAAIAAYEVDPQRLDEALRSWDAASAAPLSAAR
jgi:N-methylhydantoinase B